MPGFFADAGAHTTIYNGKKTVTTAGTRVQLTTTSTGIHTVTIRALIGNTHTIYIGNASVASTTGIEMSAGDAITITVCDLSKIYLDVATGGDGEGVTYLAT